MKLILFGATGMVGMGTLREALADSSVGVVRPGMIEPGPGITHRVKAYKAFIFVLRPLFPLFVRGLPGFCTTSERLGRAMLRVVQGKVDQYILESIDINRVGQLDDRAAA